MAGTITKGNEGVIRLATNGAEVPCLREWTLTTDVTSQSEVASCMASNGDDTQSVWARVVAVGRGWGLTLSFYWQNADEAAAPSFAVERVGEPLAIELFPDGTSGPSYEGTALIQSVTTPASIGADIIQTITLAGDGPLYFGIAPTITGAVPAEELLSVVGEVESVDASTWFTGEGLSYNASALPSGLSIDSITGLITGTPTTEAVPLFVTVTAVNPLGQASTSFDWATWDARADAKGWYDTTPSTLKTDLVASFTQSNLESLACFTAVGHELHPSGQFTLSTWVKGSAGGTGTNQNIIENFASGLGGYRFLALGDGRLYWELISQSYVIDGALDGNWQFLTLGWDGTNMVTSINGVVTTFAKTTPLQGPARALKLGRNADLDMGPTGAWDRALTSSEITALYNSGTPRHYADLLTSEKVDLVSFWNLWEPRGIRFDSHGSTHLTDNNTVGSAQGPVEVTAGGFAGITKWENQGADASPFADVVTPTALKSAQLINGLPTWDGVNSASLHSTTGTVTPDSAIYVVAKADSDGPATAGLVDSDHSILRHLIYLVSDNLRLFARPNGAFTGGEHVATTNDGHSRFGIYAELKPTGMTVEVGGETFENTSATPGEMTGLSIGGYYNQSVSGSWDGTIEAVLVFDRVLTSAELAELESLYV